MSVKLAVSSVTKIEKTQDNTTLVILVNSDNNKRFSKFVSQPQECS